MKFTIYFKILKNILVLFFILLSFNNSIKLIDSFELILKIDFNSLENYSNYECGGSLNIIKENEDQYYQSNTTIYPPCKSFGDAGHRSTQIYKNGINFYDFNISLIFLIQNPSRIDWRNYSISGDTSIGYISYYCYFEIKVENDPNAVLTIDGKNKNDFFFTYEGYSNGFFTCNSNQLTRIKLSNIRFIDWKNVIKIGNFNSKVLPLIEPKSTTPTIVDLSSIKTERVDEFIATYNIVLVSQVHLKIRDSIFDGMDIANDGAFIFFEGIFDIENCTFKNMNSNQWGIISINYGQHTNAKNLQFLNIKLNISLSFFNIYNTHAIIDNITVEGSDFSNFISFYCDVEKCGIFPQIFKNFIFRNNQLKLNLITPVYLSGVRLINVLETPLLLIKNITIESNNQIAANKELFYFYKNKNISLENIQIPEFPQFSASIVLNQTMVDIDSNSHSLFNSNVLCVGNNSHIFVNTINNETDKYLDKISMLTDNGISCKNCHFSVVSIPDRNNDNSGKNGFELVLKIDFNSLVEYSNFECGGSIKIIQVNGKYSQTNTTVYPPCKSFGDAGHRSRQFYENEIYYYDVSLIILIQNPSGIDWRNYTITSNKGIRLVRFYCYFEIRVENDPNAVLTIDGTGINDYFLIYEGYSYGFITCSSNQLTRVKLSNIKFKDWRYGCLKIENDNVANISSSVSLTRLPTIIELSNIKTERTISFITSENFIMNAQLHLMINDSVFDGMNMTNYMPIINYSGILDIYNCTFKNLQSPQNSIILNRFGHHFNANKIHFFNIKLDDSFSFISSYNTNSNINNISVENSDFSNFLSFFCDNDNPDCGDKTQYFQNIVLRNNQIKNDKKTTFGIRVFDIKTPLIYIENVTVESNNGIMVDKELFIFSATKNARLKNVKIPLIPQFSSSIVSNNTNLDIDGFSISLFNSKVLCVGASNHVTINVFKEESGKIKSYVSDKIRKDTSCLDCSLVYKIMGDVNSSKGNGGESDSSYNDGYDDRVKRNNDSYSLSSGEKPVKIYSSSFYKILIVPIVLSILIFCVIIILGLVFRKRVKQIFNNFKNKNYNDGDAGGVDNDTAVGVQLNTATINDD